MKKIYRVAIFLLAMLGLSSCLSKVQYYKHEPTHSFLYPYMSESSLKKLMSESSLKKLRKFIDNGIIFVPHFTEMDPSYHLRSGLVFYSHTMTSIYMDKAILYSGSRAYKKELTVNKEVTINKKFKSFFEGFIFLFGDKDAAGLDKLWNEDFVILEVHYRIPSEGEEGKLKKMEFKLERKTANRYRLEYINVKAWDLF